MSKERNERRKTAALLAKSDNWMVLHQDKDGISYYAPSINNMSIMAIYLSENDEAWEYVDQFRKKYLAMKSEIDNEQTEETDAIT